MIVALDRAVLKVALRVALGCFEISNMLSVFLVQKIFSKNRSIS
jgi:hypothetical protein